MAKTVSKKQAQAEVRRPKLKKRLKHKAKKQVNTFLSKAGLVWDKDKESKSAFQGRISAAVSKHPEMAAEIQAKKDKLAKGHGGARRKLRFK